jgi:predicted O-methyltransferase YrrM
MIMETTIERFKLKAIKRLVTPRLIGGMRKQADPVLRAVGVALDAHRVGELATDERWWIETIEALRADVNRSKEIVTVVDYGAGYPAETLSNEKMYEGTMTTEVVGEACREYSKSREWAMLLFHVIRKLQPVACIELGTCLGVSAAFQAAALELNGRGRLVTLEGSPSFAGVARRNIDSLGLCHRVSIVIGRFQDTLGAVLDDFGKVDYVFIDGHHDEQATIRYFDKFLPYLSEHAVVVFDDIAWSAGMRRAWRHVSDNPKVDVSLDFFGMGACLVGVGVKARYKMVIA